MRDGDPAGRAVDLPDRALGKLARGGRRGIPARGAVVGGVSCLGKHERPPSLAGGHDRIGKRGQSALRRRLQRRRLAGQRINLTAKEFALLELLLRRQGEVLPRSLIASQVWDMNFDSDTNVIEVAVRRLRTKVDDAFEPKLIRTVRGMGYVLEAGSPAPR